MKIHICCGDVYLKGYINCDIKGTLVYDLRERPEGTTLKEYFKGKKIGKRGEVVVDKQMNLLDTWHFLDKSVEEIVMISGIEHFTLSQARWIISEVKRVLIPGGLFKVDFPDFGGMYRLLNDNPEYFMRLVYCSGADDYSFHKWGWTEETFKELLGKGWKKIKFGDIVRHSYPMIGCTAEKR